MRAIAVEEAGARTTVEDLGRRGAAAFGVPPGGAFDAWALVAANRLVGNPDDAAGLELTLRGPTLVNAGDQAIAVAVVGADFAATIEGAGAPHGLPARAAGVLAPGERLLLRQAQNGVRSWLALAGGLLVPRILGSRSTDLGAHFGGHNGRALRPGDTLSLVEPSAPPSDAAWGDSSAERADGLRVLRIFAGPQIDLFHGDPLDALAATLWSVHVDSDRTGVRFAALDPLVARRLSGVAGIPPEGTTLGALQVPPSGEAIALGPDRPVTGGYAKPALIARADIPILAQLRPGERVRFERVSLDEALLAERARIAALPRVPTRDPQAAIA